MQRAQKRGDEVVVDAAFGSVFVCLVVMEQRVSELKQDWASKSRAKSGDHSKDPLSQRHGLVLVAHGIVNSSAERKRLQSGSE